MMKSRLTKVCVSACVGFLNQVLKRLQMEMKLKCHYKRVKYGMICLMVASKL